MKYKFLDDDDLTENEKADLYKIIDAPTNDDDTKCFFLDDPKSRAALQRYEKKQGPIPTTHIDGHIFANGIGKIAPEQLAAAQSMYYFASQVAGAPHALNHPVPAFCFPTAGFAPQHQHAAPQMTAAPAFLPPNHPASAALMSPATAAAAATHWQQQMLRFLPPAPGQYYYLMPAAQAVAAPTIDLHGGTVSTVEGQRGSAQSAAYGNDAAKSRNESTSSQQQQQQADIHEVDQFAAHNAGSLNNSIEIAAQSANSSVDRRSNEPQVNNNSSGGSTDVVPLDPEPNEHLVLNGSGLLLTNETSAAREDACSTVVDLRVTSTPIETDDHDAAAKDSQQFDVSPLTNEDNTPTILENTSPEKESSCTEAADAAATQIVVESAVNDLAEPVDKVAEIADQIDDMKVDEKLKNQQESLPTTASSGPPAAKSWASLFRNSPAANNAIVISKLEDEQVALAVQNSLSDTDAPISKPLQDQPNVPTTIAATTAATINVSTSTSKLTDKPQFAVAVTTIERDPPVQKLIQVLKKQYRLEHKGPVYYARGLKNFGNYCYVNAVLQALLACPPFVHLLRNLSFLEMRTPSSTPMLDALVKFVGEFFGDRYGSGRKNADEKQTAFEPTYVYNVLSSLRSDLGYRGRQEDAEEFLSLVLNHLHEEMAACLNFNNPPDQSSTQNQDVRFSSEFSNNVNNSDSAEWQQVMPGRKLATARTSKLAPTPIAQIFSGVVRNAFSQPGQKDSVNNESFFTLQLSVQNHENTSSSAPLTLQAAMMQMVHEVILRRDSSKKGDVDITRRTTFQELPLVLILHLKYFTYIDDTVKKHMKPVAYQMDLHIDRNLMPSSSNSNTKARSYKLFAVVFHHGENAEGGHYTADIFHGGQWLCMDDTKVEPVNDAHVLNFDPPRVPYLLFYRRCDVLSDNRMMFQQQQQQGGGNFAQKNRFSAAQE